MGAFGDGYRLEGMMSFQFRCTTPIPPPRRAADAVFSSIIISCENPLDHSTDATSSSSARFARPVPFKIKASQSVNVDLRNNRFVGGVML